MNSISCQMNTVVMKTLYVVMAVACCFPLAVSAATAKKSEPASPPQELNGARVQCMGTIKRVEQDSLNNTMSFTDKVFVVMGAFNEIRSGGFWMSGNFFRQFDGFFSPGEHIEQADGSKVFAKKISGVREIHHYSHPWTVDEAYVPQKFQSLSLKIDMHKRHKDWPEKIKDFKWGDVSLMLPAKAELRKQVLDAVVNDPDAMIIVKGKIYVYKIEVPGNPAADPEKWYDVSCKINPEPGFLK